MFLRKISRPLVRFIDRRPKLRRFVVRQFLNFGLYSVLRAVYWGGLKKELVHVGRTLSAQGLEHLTPGAREVYTRLKDILTRRS